MSRPTLSGWQAQRLLHDGLHLGTLRVSNNNFTTATNQLGFGQFRISPVSTAARDARAAHSTTRRWYLRWYPKTPAQNVRRSFTSGGVLLAGFSPINPTRAVATTCAAADSNFAGSSVQAVHLEKLAGQAWRRGVHTPRTKSTKANENGTGRAASQQNNEQPTQPVTPQRLVTQRPRGEEATSKYFHLPNLPHLPPLPHLPHRPTKEEFLAAANGFWERLKVRFKWYSIRSMRPWNTDEWGAFVSFFLFGHLVWILVGTTTFVSLLILSINTVFAQETLGKWVGDYLTQSAGLSIVFESAIVPRWKDGVISFRNVFVSRRPGQSKSSVSKGSSSGAAAVALAGRRDGVDDDEDDGNYTQFDLTLNTVNVTLSFVKWWNGKGLLKDVEVKGVRGVIDRTWVVWSSENVDPLSYRHEHQPGDFEVDSFKLEDLLVTIHQPSGFRPFSVSIYSCELPQLRKRYLFYDFLSAIHMSGSYDGSLFTIHPRQVHGVAAGQERIGNDLGEPDAWKKSSRLRIDGLRIDHLNRNVEGPFGWIYEGNVDIVADVMFPADDDASITKAVTEFYDRLEEAVTSNRYIHILETQTGRLLHDETYRTQSLPTDGPVVDEGDPHATRAVPKTQVPASTLGPEEDPPRYLVMDLRIHLNDVKATVPVFKSNLSYVNQALVRPIVAYINAKRTYIPIGCRIVKRASDFDGAWTIFDSGLMNDASAEVYDAFAHDVENQQSRMRRLKKVGFWTLSLAVHALFMGMAGNVV